MLCDNQLQYSWIFEFLDRSAEKSVRAIIDWATTFGIPSSLMSGEPTHFKKKTLHLFSEGLTVPQNFALRYFSRSNESVERLGRDLL